MRARERLERNERLFREINERIRSLTEEMPTADGDRWAFLCECGQADCVRQIELDIPEYESVREDPTHFVVLPGHEQTEHEVVVARHDGWLVVEKPWMND